MVVQSHRDRVKCVPIRADVQRTGRRLGTVRECLTNWISPATTGCRSDATARWSASPAGCSCATRCTPTNSDEFDIEIEESDTAVVVSATVCSPPEGDRSELCEIPFHVYLDRPLGQRVVLDGNWGRTVPYKNIYASLAADMNGCQGPLRRTPRRRRPSIDGSSRRWIPTVFGSGATMTSTRRALTAQRLEARATRQRSRVSRRKSSLCSGSRRLRA